MAPDGGQGYRIGGSFYQTLTAAVADLAEYGFDSAERVEIWIRRIREAAVYSMTPPHVLERSLQETFRSIYRDKIERGGILRQHPGVPKFTIDRVKPRLRGALDRAIMASASQIKIDRTVAIEKVVQRFSGWATSIPAGGSDAVSKVDTKADIKKSIATIAYQERRVNIDQGHKFVANLNNIIAVDGGALAAKWHSHAGEMNYNYRPEHAKREGHIFVVRDNWAIQRGLMKLDGAKYTDEIDQPAEFVYCRCYYEYLYSLRRLPDSMLTEKGRSEMAAGKRAA